MSLTTKISGVLSADEVSALKSKYDNALDRDDYVKYVFLPALVPTIYAIICTYSWWLALLSFALGALYGFKVVLPAIIQEDYYYNSMVERDSFCINMTQILTDPSRTLNSAIERATSRAKGELKKDLMTLQANTTGASKEQVVASFKELRNKYHEDIAFTQYIEQLETIYLQGKIDLEPLKDISNQHQDIMKKQYQYQEDKDIAWRGVKRMLYISYAILLIIEMSFGFKVSYEAFCRSIIGWITSAIYVSIILSNLNSFRKNYFNTSIMSIKMKAKSK